MTGWTGKILRIDLTCGDISAMRPDPTVYETHLGGRALAGHFLEEYCHRPWNDPDMPVLFMTGPLVGTAAPTSGRMTLMSRSPLTGAVGDGSVGGSLGTALKQAGWDGMILTGISPRWAGIRIDADRVTLTDAAAWVGVSTDQAHEALKPEGATAVIGAAAEQGVAFANVIVDGHYAAGRCGLGLSLAAKRIKYLTVRGRGRILIADPEGMQKAAEDVRRLTAASPALMGEFGLSRFGTPALYDLTDSRRMMPTDNFRRSFFPFAAALNAPALHRRHPPRKTGCRGCHIRCKQRAPSGENLPEFETLSHFTALVGNQDMETVLAANGLCNRWGMDTISAAATLACHAEGRGRDLAAEEIPALLNDMVSQRGIGRTLARGSAVYAAALGRPEISMSVKGLELPAYDPRGAYGMALAYAVSTRGGCHLRAYPIAHEILRKPVSTDRFSFTGKARIIKIGEDLNAVADSLTACKFVFFAASLEEYAPILQAATGCPTSAQDLLALGERVIFRERRMNARNGFTVRDDDLPARFFTETGGGDPGHPPAPINREAFLAARERYYRIRGLDAEGLPPRDAPKQETPWTA